MPKYKVLAKSFINNAIAEPGDIVEYDGTPGDNLEPIDKPAQSAATRSSKANIESIARQKAAAIGGDPDAIATAAAVDAAAQAAEQALGAATEAAGSV